MKKTFRRLILKTVDILNYLAIVGKRIFKVTVQSAVICFPVMLALLIINSILGVHIRLFYYVMLNFVCTLGVSFLLCLFKLESIIARPVKVSRKTIPAKTDRKTQRAVQRKRRKIS